MFKNLFLKFRDQGIQKELLRYFFVCIFSFSADFATLVALEAKFGVHYLWAAFYGLLVGNVCNYLLSIKFVFSHRKVKETHKELGVYIIVGLCSLPIHQFILWFCTDKLEIFYQVSKLIAAGSSFLAIFFLRKTLLFWKTQHTENQS